MEGRPLRILIAEDDDAVATLYSTYARRRGHDAIRAADGAEALLLAATERPDLIMLDVAMPKLDGRDVCQQLKKNPLTAEIPILVVTAFGGDQQVRDQLLEMGAGDVLEKPIDLQIAFNKAERLAGPASERS
jgi:DNA-binding response OmpR family regulator